MESTMEDRELSRAIVAYVAKGRSAFPRSDVDAVTTFASEHGLNADELLARVRAILDECMSIEIDWQKNSLVEGGTRAQRVMAERHPELGQDALDALFWTFTYNWR